MPWLLLFWLVTFLLQVSTASAGAAEQSYQCLGSERCRPITPTGPPRSGCRRRH